VDVFSAPAIGYVKILVHRSRLAGNERRGERARPKGRGKYV